jgi:hypothetical protein
MKTRTQITAILILLGFTALIILMAIKMYTVSRDNKVTGVKNVDPCRIDMIHNFDDGGEMESIDQERFEFDTTKHKVLYDSDGDEFFVNASSNP